MAERFKIGDEAPDFTLKDQKGNDVTLSGCKGKKVVLSFHGLAWTSVCTQQMKDLEANRDRLEKANAVAFGLSVDSSFCKKAWAESIGIVATPLLADFWPHGGVAQKYGVFNEQIGVSKRTVFVLDEKGTIKFHKIYPTKEVPDIEEIMKQVE